MDIAIRSPDDAAGHREYWKIRHSASVISVHGRLDTFRQPALDGLGHRVQQFRQQRPLVVGELVEDKVREVPAVGGRGPTPIRSRA